jgi:ATPase subunit of ABC transporter with duplicated ATPase domains
VVVVSHDLHFVSRVCPGAGVHMVGGGGVAHVGGAADYERRVLKSLR